MDGLQIDPEVARRYPGYACLVVYAHEVTNGPSDETSVGRLRAAGDQQRRAFAGRKPADDPHMGAWREAYRAFGLKPGRYLNSAEALLTRILKGDALPPINRLVDLYNAISLKHGLPAGGEDLDQVRGIPTLRLASGDEPFDTMRDGAPILDHPERGEVVWADQLGITCRGWNWRQGLRTRLTESSRNAYFILDRLPPYSMDALRAAGHDLASAIRSASPACRLEITLIGPAVETSSGVEIG